MRGRSLCQHASIRHYLPEKGTQSTGDWAGTGTTTHTRKLQQCLHTPPSDPTADSPASHRVREIRLQVQPEKPATTGMMQTTVVSTMVSHTVGWASVLKRYLGEEAGNFRGHRAGLRAASQSSPFLFLAAPLSQSQNLSHLWPLFLLPKCLSPNWILAPNSTQDFRSAFVLVGFSGCAAQHTGS